MQRHNLDGNLFDYTWKQNRLSKDKEALKNSVLNVIRKRPKLAGDAPQTNAQSRVAQPSNAAAAQVGNTPAAGGEFGAGAQGNRAAAMAKQ